MRFLAERFDACYGSNVDPIDTVVRMSAQVCRGLNITCNAGVHCLERMRLGSGERGGACVASMRRLTRLRGVYRSNEIAAKRKAMYRKGLVKDRVKPGGFWPETNPRVRLSYEGGMGN